MYYKAPNNSVYFLDDNSFIELLPTGSISITEEQAEQLVIERSKEPELTQFEKDQLRYQKRAAVKDQLIAWMAADNLNRVRSGDWDVQDLQQLLADLSEVNAMMQTLSFELAAQAIQASTNPLLTTAIKTAWVNKLTENFYLS